MKKRIIFLFVICCMLAAGLFFLLKKRHLSLAEGMALCYRWKGMDVSHYQGEIDWKHLKAKGISFAYIKATEGSGLSDAYFAQNFENAEKNGVVTGAYHFFSFDSDAKTQAQNYIRAVGNLSGHLIPAIDVEYYGSYIAHPKEAEEVRAHLKELLAELETFYHVKPMIYTTPSAYRRYIKGAFEEYPLWIRNVYYHPSLLMLGRQWDLWQYTDRAQLGGYTGGTKYVDLNVFRKRKIDEYICP